MHPVVIVLNLLQVAGGVLLLHLTGHLNFLLGKSEFNHDTCTFKPLADVHSPHDLCGALSALALASVLAWFLIQLLKGMLSLICSTTDGDGRREACVEVVARCTLAFGWVFLAIALTIALHQADMDIHAQDTTFGSDSRSVLAGTVVGGTQNGMQGVAGLSTRDALLGDPKQVKVLLIVLWVMAAIALGLALFAVGACCLACCCCCCGDSLYCWAPCAAACCLCCSDGRRGDDCCSPLCCAEMLCLGWLLRKMWQPDPRCEHTQHHCHAHAEHYYHHPPMPPPPPQVLVHGSGYGYGAQHAPLQEPLLSGGRAPLAGYGYMGGGAAAWSSQPGGPSPYQPPVVHTAPGGWGPGGAAGKGSKDVEYAAPSAPPQK